MRRRTLLANVGASGASILGTSVFSDITSGKSRRKGGVHAYTDDFTTENLGPHNLSFPMASGELIDGTMYFGTRIARPSGIGVFDLDSGQSYFREATNRKGSMWGSTSINNGNDLYISTGSGETKLYHFDIVEDEVTEAFDMGNDAHINWDVDAADGDTKVYIGSSAPSQLWEYDHLTGEGGHVYGPKLTNAKFTRSVSADTETVYAGIGDEAQLIAIDRETEEKEVIFYASNEGSVLSNESFVYELGGTEDYLAFGTNGTPLIGYINKNDHTDYHVTEAPNIHPVVDAIKMQSNIIYFTAKFPATLYRYDISADELTQLAEVPGIATRDIFVRDNQVIGLTESNFIWTYNTDSDTLNSQNVLSSNLEGVPQVAQSVSGHEGKGYVGASGQTSVHNPETESVTRFSAPGEPKSQEWVEGVLYQACYSNGDLVKYNPETNNSELIPRVARSQPKGRVRPRAMHYDKNTGTLFIGTQKDDVSGGGDLFAFNPESEQVVNTYQDFFGDEVAAITSLQNSGTNSIFAGSNSLVEVDPNTGEKLRTLPASNEIFGLTTLQRPRPGAPQTMDYLYGIGRDTLFATDPDTESLVFEKDLPGGSLGKLKSYRGLIFGGGSDTMYVCDPGAEEVSIVLDDLNGDWHNRQSIGIDENNAYVISDTDLVKVDHPHPPEKYFRGRS